MLIVLQNDPPHQTVGLYVLFTVETHHPEVVVVMDDLDGPSEQYGPYSQ